jgi:hypothetical protein
MFVRDAPGLMGLRITAGNRYAEYYNYLDNNISFDMHLPVGDSILVFEDSLQRVRIKLVSATPTTSFGNPDSLLNFTFIHTDLTDNVLTTPLHGSAVSFSKLYGMMNGYAMDSFPYVLTPVTLLGVRGPNVGFHGLSRADVYDFQAGDWYETHSYAAGGPPHNNYHRYTMLSRTDFTDRVEYNIREDHQTLSTMGPPPYVYVYSTDTNVHVRYKTQWLDETMPWGLKTERYYVSNTILDCNITAYSYEASINECYAECPGTPCIGSGDCFMTSKYDFRYTAQAGNIRQSNESIPSPWISGYEELIYLNANGIECGLATLGVQQPVLLNHSVNIYPNPAQDNITIETGDLSPFLVSITITDLAGKTILSPAVSGSSKINIGISALPAGTYWIRLQTTQGPVTKKLVVIH